MKRYDFIKQITLGTLSMVAIDTWAKGIRDLPDYEFKLPVLFIGHGSPMNAIETNDFTQTLVQLGEKLPKPNAILCISAHWTTKGTYVNVSPNPKMIYDMYGFPKELYEVDYPAKGAPAIAKEIPDLILNSKIKTDTEWGFDHGTWSILKHLYPKVDVPVFQMSIDYNKPMQFHYDLAKQLNSLRKKRVLIIGSGNLTHNLRIVDFPNINATPRDWALEFDSKIKQYIDNRNHQAIIHYEKIGASAKLAVPEPSHFFPLIYALALQDNNEEISYFYEKIHYGTLSMRGVKIG
jgi:4,5-DOPA dioxygenase extradiol